MPGPAPKPTVLKLIEGNRGKRALPRNEPKPRGNLKATKPPAQFTEAQAEVWRYTLESCPPGLLVHLDRDLLVAWCQASELHARSCRLQNERDAKARAEGGEELLAKVRGGYMMSPYIPIINRQAVLLLQLSNALGFSPSARTRINAPEDEAPKDPGAKYI